MATKGVYTKVLIGGYALSSSTNSSTINAALQNEETTPFEASGKEFVTLNPDTSVDIGGYMTFDTTDTTFESRVKLAIDTADTIGVVYGQTPAGSPGYVLPGAYTSNFQIQTPIAGVMTTSGSFVSDTGLRRGICVYSGTISATGATAAIDIGAAGSAGGFAYLFVTTETGTGTGATIDLESSATEGGVYASEGTFTFSAIGANTITLSGTVNRWLRLNCTSLGGATSWVVHCIACVSGVTY